MFRRLQHFVSAFSLAIVILLVAAADSAAQSTWVLTTADFRSERVTLQSIDATGALVSTPTGDQKRRIELDHLLMLDRADKPASTPAKFVVVLSDNDRVAGQSKAIVGENLQWTSPLLGEMTLPLKSVVCITRANGQPTSAPAQGGPQTEDVVTLLNGDTVRGIISGITEAAVSVQPTGGAGGEATSVPFDSVSRITFATTATSAPAMVHGFRVGLSDGSGVIATSIQLADQRVTLNLPDGTVRSLSQAALFSVEHVNGPVVWLSSLPPTESVQTPFLDLSWPAKTDRAVDGELIRFGDRTFARGIGVHSYSRLTWNLDPSFKVFRTQYAISGDRPYANVAVRIKLDGQVVHEQNDFRAGTLSPPVMIELSGEARQLTLEVDYGQNYDVQDRFNWIEPALLRFRPETPAPPTTTSSPATTLPASNP
ncbi:MAG TPA: NPCBM/NEW2 domain-containing protein [Tepidisphaeraceae bacterium]|jgi:hypothetical protein